MRLRAQTQHLLLENCTNENGHLENPNSSTPSSALAIDATQPYELFHGLRVHESLEGFMMIFEIASPHRILYVSQTVANFTGLALVDLIGRSIFDYIHPEDGEEIGKELERVGNLIIWQQSQCLEQTIDCPMSFQVRFKSTTNKRGVYFKNPGFRFFSIIGRIKQGVTPSDNYHVLRRSANNSSVSLSTLHFVGSVIAIPSTSICEYQLSRDQIVFKLDCDFKIREIDVATDDCKWSELIEMTRTDKFTLYNVCHPDSLFDLQKTHKQRNKFVFNTFQYFNLKFSIGKKSNTFV